MCVYDILIRQDVPVPQSSNLVYTSLMIPEESSTIDMLVNFCSLPA